MVIRPRTSNKLLKTREFHVNYLDHSHQLAAGFVLTGFYEDIDADPILGKHIPSFIVTRALKP